MPTFNTPEPIAVTLSIVAGNIHINATDRTDTVVEVHPSDPSAEIDVRAADQTRVDYTNGQLSVRAPRPRAFGLFGRTASIDVTVELPAGSRVTSDAAAAALDATGRLGECRIKTSAGEIHLDDTGGVDLTTGAGEISVGRVAGDAEVTTGSGRVRLRHVDGLAVIKNSNGESWIGTAGGDLRVHGSNGSITVEHAQGGVTATTAMGDVRIGEVVRGAVSLKTAMGGLDVGVRTGTAAWLDAQTKFGRVHNRLQAAAAPAEQEDTVEVRARTSFGDIVIHHTTEEAVA